MHLGFSRFPLFKQNLHDPKGVTIKSQVTLFHADFRKIVDTTYLNNIAVIKLSNPVPISTNIQPAKLISNRETEQLPGKYVNVTGWKHYLDSDLITAQVQIRNRDTCEYYFQILQEQEGCIKWKHPNHQLDILGNIISQHGSIIGFQTTTPPCKVKGDGCTQADKILYVSSFSDWIAQIIDEPAATVTKPENDESSKRIEHLFTVIEEMKSQQEAYKSRLNTALDAIDKLEQKHKREAQYNMFLSEELNSVKSEVINNEAKQNETILSLEEQVASARTEIANGLSANKVTVDILGKELNDSKAEVIIKEVLFNDQIKKLADEVNFKNADLQNRISVVNSDIGQFNTDHQSRVHHIAFELQHNISDLKNEMNTLYEEQITAVLHIHERMNQFDTVLIDIKTEVVNLKICSDEVQSNHKEWYSNVTKELTAIDLRIKSQKDDNKTPQLEHKLDSVIENYTHLKEKVNKVCTDIEKLTENIFPISPA